MKRFEFNELIEKAFSMGYEYAQKEFGNKENKRKRKEWEWNEADKIGQKLIRDGVKMTKGDAIRAQRLKNVAETHGGVGRYFDEENIPHDIYSDEVLDLFTGEKKDRSVHHKINTRSIIKNRSGKITKKSLQKGIEQDVIISDLGDVNNVHVNANRYETMRTGGKRESTEDFINRVKNKVKNLKKENEEANKKINEAFENTKKSFDDIANKKIEALDRLENIRKIRTKKNLKKAGLALAGTAAVAGTAYGIKKLRDRKKEERTK